MSFDQSIVHFGSHLGGVENRAEGDHELVRDVEGGNLVAGLDENSSARNLGGSWDEFERSRKMGVEVQSSVISWLPSDIGSEFHRQLSSAIS